MESFGTVSFPNITIYSIAIYATGIIAEVMLIYFGRVKGRYERNDAITSLLMGTGNVVVTIAYAFIILNLMYFAYEHRIFDLEINWLTGILCFIADDFRRFVFHAGTHRIRWWWADHVNHHSSQHFNLTTALRQPWTSLLTGAFVLYMPLAWLGFHPLLVLFVGGINLIYQFFLHTETVGKLWKPVEFVFNTPSHHRVHHSNNPRYLDSNYGAALIIWDRIFGTFVEERDEDVPQYGIVSDIATFNIFLVAFHEWIDMFRDVTAPGLTLRQRLGYVFMPPGWSHDGSRKGSEELKADYVRLNPDQAGMPGLPALPAATQAPQPAE